MEAAGTALAEAVAGLAPQGPVRILCGKGNNGGDGLVAARRLRRLGFEVEALELFGRSDASPPTSTPGWRAAGARSSTRSSAPASRARRASRRPAAIEAINRCGAPCRLRHRLRGRRLERRGRGVAVEADLTVSFHAAKLGHRIAPGKWHTGELRVAPIGIPDGAPATPAAGDDRARCPRPGPARAAPRSTKFSSGQVAIAGGSRGLTGAVRMSSLAAIRAGAGYATVAVPADLEAIFESASPR